MIYKKKSITKSLKDNSARIMFFLSDKIRQPWPYALLHQSLILIKAKMKHRSQKYVWYQSYLKLTAKVRPNPRAGEGKPLYNALY